MPRYDSFIYNTTGYYGQRSLLGFSVQPFTAVVIDYDKVKLTWASLTSTFNAVRLVRNQITFPETEEDGVVLWEETGLSGSFSKSTYTDGVDNFTDGLIINNSPLIGGRFAYYRMWLRKDDNAWYPAGDVSTLIPKNHSATAFPGTVTQTTHEKVMDLLPKTFTSATGSPLDLVDTSSTLYSFLKGFSLTLDELLTYADVLKPDFSGLTMPPQLVGAYVHEYGLPQESGLSLRTAKRLIRESAFIKENKGTALGVQTLSESLTGFAPTVTPTNNLMLTIQDSTFYKGVGNWFSVGNCALTSSTDLPTPEDQAYSIDAAYIGKVVVSTAGAAIENGSSTPVTRGVPVTGGKTYSFSMYARSASSSPALNLAVKWYDYLGQYISTSSGLPSLISNSWARVNADNVTAPDNAAYAALGVYFATTGTFYLDMVQMALQANADVYQEARGVNVTLAPKKINYLNNPSFDELNTWWTITDSSHTLAESEFVDKDGPSVLLQSVTNNSATSSYVTTTATDLPLGQFYTFSFYGRTTSGTETFTISLSADDGTTTVTNSKANVVLGTTWSRPYVTVFVPSTMETATQITCTISGTTHGHTVQLDTAQLEVGFYPTGYFDGEFPVVSGASWAGTKNESISYLYPNKGTVIPRLIDNLKQYLPFGTPFSISTYNGLEFVGIS